jgi:hypothetical protein
MSFLQRENFQEILFKSSIASRAVYEDDPQEYLIRDASFNHEIKKIHFSQSYNDQGLKYFNKLYHVKYLIIDDEKNKRLYIAFRGTQTLQDVLNDVKIYSEINGIKGRFHSGFYQLAENVPLEYFISKLADEDYELIFTGHSLGAAIAAMITIKILYRPQMTKKYSDKIMFIGYGCPSIADIYFQIENDQIYKDNFIFIKNENDIVVDILDYISYLIYNNNQEYLNSLNIFAGFFEKILGYINNKEVLTIQILEPLCRQITLRTAATTIIQLIIPQYTQFGSLFKLTTEKGLDSVENYNFDEQLFQIFNDPGRLIGKIQDHFIDNYFRKLKNKYFQNKIDLRNRNNSISIDLINDLELEIILEEPNLEMYKNANNTEIKLYVKNNNNIDHLIAIKLVFGETIIYFEKEIRKLFTKKDDCIEIDFVATNDLLFDENGEKLHDKFTLEFYSHFNKPKPIRIDPRNIREGLNQKLKTIQDMPFDLLYLHAALNIHIMNRMASNSKNIKNEKFMEAKVDLVRIFVSLDEILNELWEKKIDAYTENDIKEIKNLASEYLDYLNVNNEDKYKYIEIFRDIQFESKLIGFEKSLELAKNPEELLKKIVPYLYEIKKRKFRISTLSNYLFDKIYDRTFFEKLQESALNLGFVAIKAGVLIGVGAAGVGAAGVGVAGAAAVAGAVAAGAGIAAVGAVTGVAGAAGAVAAGAGAVFAGEAAVVGTSRVLAKANTVIDTIENQYKFNLNWGENKVYEEIVKSINKNNDTLKKTIRDNENKFDENFIKNWPEKCDHDIFKIIILNRQIRDILCENNIIGSIGTVKAGKSTFVKLISNQDVPTSATNPTTYATPYSICENNQLQYANTIIIDYPHFNNSNLIHKLEFYFTRLLLSHIYLLFPAINQSRTDNEQNLYKLITSDKFFGLTFLYNQSDAFYNNDDDDDIDNIKIDLNEFKTTIRQNLNARINEEILFTCMKKRGIDEFKKHMIRDGVYLEEELKTKVFELLNKLEEN